MQALDNVYSYMTTIGIGNKTADCFVSECFSLEEKPPKPSFLHRLFSFNKKSSAPSLVIVCANIRNFLSETPSLSEDEKYRACFVLACLENVKAGRDKHLITLGKLNQLRKKVLELNDEQSPYATHFKLLEKKYCTLQQSSLLLEKNIKKACKLIDGEKPKEKAPIDTLPQELIDIILSNLGLKDRLTARLTSKRWANISWTAVSEKKEFEVFKQTIEPKMTFKEAYMRNAHLVKRIQNNIYRSKTFYSTQCEYGFVVEDTLYCYSTNRLCVLDLKKEKEVSIDLKQNEYLVGCKDRTFTIEANKENSFLKKWDLDNVEVETHTHVKLASGVKHFYLNDTILYSVDPEGKKLYQQTIDSPSNFEVFDFSEAIKADLPYFIYQDHDTKELYVKNIYKLKEPKKLLPDSHCSSFIGSDCGLIFLLSERGNILIYDATSFTRKKVVTLKIKDIHCCFIHKGILWLVKSDKKAFIAVDLISGKPIHKERSWRSHEILGFHNNSFVLKDIAMNAIQIKSLQ